VLVAAMHSCRDAQWLSRLILLAVLVLNSALADAQWLDRIDVVPGKESADIVIRFAQKILYQRHAPPNEGKILRVFIGLVDGQEAGNGFIEETLWAQKTERVPAVAVAFRPFDNNGMLITFSQATKYSVRPGPDGQSIVISVPLLPAKGEVSKPAAVTQLPTVPEAPKGAQAGVVPKPAALPESPAPVAKETVPMADAVPPAQAPADVEALAAGFMNEARRAMAGKDGATVVNRLYRVLGLPGNSQTQVAQALIGEARELNGEIAKARAEYELYLKLFPNGADAARLRQRLAALPKDAAAARATAPRALPKEAGPAEWSFFGSVSAYYYTGKSQIDTLVPPPPGQLTFSQSTLSMVDQDSLITSLNLNARRRDAFSDTRVVVRDTDNKNYLNPQRSYNRLYSAYLDHNDRKVGYYVRAGRQNPNGMGVLERFDGVQAGYNLTQQWRLNAVYGEAVEFDSPFKKVFYGASVDLLPQAGYPGASVYAVNQTLDGLPNRRAVGSEVRYFDGHLTAYGMVDYDVLYNGLNIAMLQGNYLSGGGTNYFFSIDHRQAPTYSLTNALLAAPGLSLQDMVAAQGLDVVRAQAKDLAALSDMFSVGFTHPVTERWQVGADYRVSEISSTKPVVAAIPLAVIGTCLGTVDPVNDTCLFNTASQQGTGKSHVVTMQAIGNSLLVANAVGVASVSFIMAPTYSGQSLSLNYVLPIGERWRFDTNLRYYTQKDDVGGSQDRLSPSFKVSYQWQNSLYLEGEIGREISNSHSEMQTDHTKRDYLYTGTRWDFR
jgi:hypothetical protein